ncbi:MAG: hypothetical protein Kow0026_08540 [Oricola sp.]
MTILAPNDFAAALFERAQRRYEAETRCRIVVPRLRLRINFTEWTSEYRSQHAYR